MWLTPKLDWTEENYYNAEDLNRVENNTLEVAQLIQKLMGIKVNLEGIITNRDYSTIEFADSLNRVERNLQKLSVLNLDGLKSLKTNWQAGDSFNYKDAIRLENNLSILYGILSKNIININYCGTFNCGEEII
ncbi:hypothetical protein [Clostridium algidicarnis]|uniref:hypothetical protein n=1 Tax=Clostridium algidicarnis TaxID=37659 RepID=UPI001C0E02C0|nr:hypothetical protein [Clostridium algidicarnis]MBU3226812.1 hypothetical protein [Clostridium algidicarnis]MBU3250277.1 hypothetical protein [Clostridium algidicarnis]